MSNCFMARKVFLLKLDFQILKTDKFSGIPIFHSQTVVTPNKTAQNVSKKATPTIEVQPYSAVSSLVY